MFFLLLEQYPILAWIGFCAPIVGAFLVLRSRRHFTGNEKTIIARSGRAKAGDEVQIICTEDGQYSSGYGTVTKTLEGQYPGKVHSAKGYETRDFGSNHVEIELDEIVPRHEYGE